MDSFPRFIGVIAVWVVLLTGLYFWAARGDAWSSFEDSVISFFSFGAPIDGRALPASGHPYAAVVCLASVSGVFHLGIFVSHLYTLVSRK
jgi:hypothetical protein